MFNSTTQSVNSSADTAALFDSEEYDTSSFHSTVSNTSRIVAPFAGYYLFTFGCFVNASVSSAHLSWRLNGTTAQRPTALLTTIGSSGYLASCSAILKLALADYVEAMLFQTSGGAVAFGHASSTDAQATLTCTLLGI